MSAVLTIDAYRDLEKKVVRVEERVDRGGLLLGRRLVHLQTASLRKIFQLLDHLCLR